MHDLQHRTTPSPTMAEQAAVAELIVSGETPFARPSITMPTGFGPYVIVVVGPAEPVDEPDDE